MVFGATVAGTIWTHDGRNLREYVDCRRLQWKFQHVIRKAIKIEPSAYISQGNQDRKGGDNIYIYIYTHNIQYALQNIHIELSFKGGYLIFWKKAKQNWEPQQLQGWPARVEAPWPSQWWPWPWASSLRWPGTFPSWSRVVVSCCRDHPTVFCGRPEWPSLYYFVHLILLWPSSVIVFKLAEPTSLPYNFFRLIRLLRSPEYFCGRPYYYDLQVFIVFKLANPTS